MASSPALWNEVARLANIEFFENEQPLTGALLMQLIIAVTEMLTEEPPCD
jgi:hypothetical protein